MDLLLALVHQHNAKFRPIRDEEPVQPMSVPPDRARGVLIAFADQMPPEEWTWCWAWGKCAGIKGWMHWPHSTTETWAQDRENWCRLAAQYPHWTDHQGQEPPDWTPTSLERERGYASERLRGREGLFV